MENLYSVRLEAVMRARKGENQSECQTDLVAEERWNCLQLLDWSHSGLIAVAVNKCSVESVNGASVLQHCAIALFDANEPHVVAIRWTEHHPNAVMDFLSSDEFITSSATLTRLFCSFSMITVIAKRKRNVNIFSKCLGQIETLLSRSRVKVS